MSAEQGGQSAEIDAGDPNHPEAVDCDGYPLSGRERCGYRTHRPYVIPPVVAAPERDRAAEVEAAEDRAEQAAFDAMRERS